MTDLQTFDLFPHLPSELRLKIWTLLFPPPQNLSVRFSSTTNRYLTNSPPSPLLSTSSESRSHYLSTYHNLILSPTYESSIFIDFTKDTLFFDNLNCSPGGDLSVDLQRSPQRDKIQRVIFDVQLWEVLRVFRWDSLSEVGTLSGLKNVALVLRRDGGDRGYGGDQHHMSVFGNTDREIQNATVDSGITNAVWYVNCLRWEIEKSTEAKWDNGVPNVQMWLW